MMCGSYMLGNVRKSGVGSLMNRYVSALRRFNLKLFVQPKLLLDVLVGRSA
jgi:hypothetical protein